MGGEMFGYAERLIRMTLHIIVVVGGLVVGAIMIIGITLLYGLCVVRGQIIGWQGREDAN
jgi:hypothetical protein